MQVEPPWCNKKENVICTRDKETTIVLQVGPVDWGIGRREEKSWWIVSFVTRTAGHGIFAKSGVWQWLRQPKYVLFDCRVFLLQTYFLKYTGTIIIQIIDETI